MMSVKNSLARKISVRLLIGVLAVFVAAMGSLFVSSRQMVKKEAYERGERMLANTRHRVEAYLNEAEVATHNIYWQAQTHLQPDSLLAYSRRVVELNPSVNSCSISTEPYFFEHYGHCFSAYSVRRGDSIVTVTVSEGEYDYFDMTWYQAPRDAGKAVWVDPFDDTGVGSLYSGQMIASYCEPLYDGTGRFVGVISTDISLLRLSQAISAEKPYPNSYAMMLGHEGHYFLHPDTSRLVVTTIFDDVDPEQQPDLIALGRDMLDGHKGVRAVKDGSETYVTFYEPVPQAGWSLALVCPESDIFAGYNRFSYVVLPLLAVGLLLLLVFCLRTVSRFIAPLEQLSRQARHIAEGHFDDRMEHSDRSDIVGRLQNNFALMQETLDEHIGKLRDINAESEQRNQELILANERAAEADRQKTSFLQDMSHQIRTPLNIIMGFAQVLRDGFSVIPSQEVETIAGTMQKSAVSVNRMVNMLVAAAAVADSHEKAERHDVVNLRQLAHDLATEFNNLPPRHIPLTLDVSVPEKLTILTNRDYLTKALDEVLYNARKFTVSGTITLRLRADDRAVSFIVEDTGPGIPTESRDRIFTRFHKLDDFGEGLGLGLSISRQFAQMLGGDLYLDPAYTGGSRFVLEVPLKIT